MSYLILIRHGQSQWNEKGLWTGWQNPPLTDQGTMDAKNSANFIKDIKIDYIFTSPLTRVTQTCDIIKHQLGLETTPCSENSALNERNYGDFTGKNKWQVKEEVGEATFQKIRRSWDYPIPNGETMEAVYQRVVPYYQEEIFPKLQIGQNVLIVSSGNTLRSLVKHLDNLTNDQVADLEFGIGEVYVYQIGENGKVTSKEIRNENPNRGKI